jgi:5-methylcytosine-specific restriction endonuclease McrA
MQEKRCTKCGETKPLDAFSPRGDGKGRDGRASHCKVCRSAARTVFYWANKPVRQAYVKANRHLFREQSRRRRADPEIRAQINAAARERQRRDPEYLARARINVARREALKRAAFVEDVDSLVVLERHDGACGICGGDVDPFDFHVDHIVPLARGGEHSYRNTQPAHPVCNLRKGVKTPSERSVA